MTTSTTIEKQPKKSSSVRHTRAIQRDRSKRPAAMPPDEQIEARLGELIHPATLRQVAYFHQLGLRERVLTLPIMVALVISMIWRQIPGASELVRIVRRELVLWVPTLQVSQQAFSERLRTLPAELFLQVLLAVLPRLHTAWQQRQRPLPPEVAWAQVHYTQVALVDGSTLDALLRKVGLLRDAPLQPLAGRMTGLLDLCSRLPFQIWYERDAQAHDLRFWPRILSALQAGALLIFDLGYTNFAHFTTLTSRGVTFITRAKSNLAYTLERSLLRTSAVHDSLVWIGSGDTRQLVRLVQVLYRGKWYRYLTNELDIDRLPTAYVVALYWQRWRIEDAYAIVKRLLGLAYFYGGAQNAVEMQVWATWLLYAVLVDLTDAVAEALNQPFAAISMEMVYRGLYHFTQAYHRGEATDVVAFLAADAKLYGIIKRKRKTQRKSPLIELAHLTNLHDP
jgi:hypothetical protein